MKAYVKCRNEWEGVVEGSDGLEIAKKALELAQNQNGTWRVSLMNMRIPKKFKVSQLRDEG